MDLALYKNSSKNNLSLVKNLSSYSLGINKLKTACDELNRGVTYDSLNIDELQASFEYFKCCSDEDLNEFINTKLSKKTNDFGG